MLEASDEIDLKPSLRACSRRLDFISVNNAFLFFFGTCVFFSNSLKKKRINGWSKIFEKKKIGPHACLTVNKVFFSLVSLAS